MSKHSLEPSVSTTAVSDEARYELKQLQQNLGLRNEIINKIEAQAIQAYEQKLKQYEEELTVAIHLQYPLSNETCQLLQQLQQSLGISEENSNEISAQVTQAYEQKLQQYEQAFIWASQRQYPISDEDREFLEFRRQKLNLNKEVTNSIEESTQLLKSEKNNYKNDDCPTLPDNQKNDESITHRVKPTRQLLFTATAIAAVVGVGAFSNYTYNQWIEQSAWANLEQAKTLKQRKNYGECEKQAQAVPQKSSFYPKAQNLLNECQRLAKDQKWLAQAKRLAENKNFKDAIATAVQIQSSSSFLPEAQGLINQWSENLLKHAEVLYKQSYNPYNSQTLENAINITKDIPQTSSVAKNANEAAQKWRTEWDNNENFVQAAYKALKEEKWQQALDEANKVRLLGQEVKQDTPYWKNELKPIIEQAQERIAAIEKARKERIAASSRQKRETNPPPANPPTVKRPIPPTPRSPSGGWPVRRI